MEAKKNILVLALSLMVWLAGSACAAPLGTAFSYQGRLIDANAVADGLYDLQFKLFDDPNIVIGNQIGSDVNVPDMDVIDGYFTVYLDFNDVNAFNGDVRWLQIGIRPGDMNDPNEYTFLEPRQEITPAPYSFYAEMAGGINMPEGAQEGFVLTSDANGLGSWQSSGGGINGHSHHSLDADDGSPTEAVYVDSIGNVGIGTTNPICELDVEGIIRSSNAGTSTGEVQLSGPNGSPGLAFFSNDPEGYRANIVRETYGLGIGVHADSSNPGVDELYIRNSGNVGIGTTNPSSKFEIQSDWGHMAEMHSPNGNIEFLDTMIKFESLVTNAAPQLWLVDQDNRNDRAIIHAQGKAGAVEALWVSSSGNVGIGTTNPVFELDVEGVIRSSNVANSTGEVQLSGPNGSPGLIFLSNDPEGYRANIVRDPYGLGIGVHEDTSNPGVDEFYIRNSGNVGIGTTNPGAKLEVNGQVKITGGSPGTGKVLTSNSTGLASWQNPSSGGDNLGNHTATQNIKLNGHYLSGDGGNEGVYVDSDGKVGIGTDSLSLGKLEVWDNSSTRAIYGRNDGSGTGVYGYSDSGRGVYGYSDSGRGVYGDTYSGYGVYGHSTSGYAGYFAGPKSYFSGNVGIGTTAPMGKLEVSGGVVRIWDGTASIAWATTEGELYVENNLEVDGGAFIQSVYTTPAVVGRDVYVTPNGQLGYLSSSKRYKENIAPLEEDFSKILQAQPVTFTAKKSKEQAIGLIAEDLDELGLNNLVGYDDQGRPDNIRYEFVSLYLLEVIKNQAKSIEQLKSENALFREELQAENESLKTQLKAENESLKRRLAVLEKVMEQVQVVTGKEVQL